MFGWTWQMTHIFNNAAIRLIVEMFRWCSLLNGLFCSCSQWTCVCKCLGLFDCSPATSGSIVAYKSEEGGLVYSTMINQRARARSWTGHQLQWPKAENPKEKHTYLQLNTTESLTMVTVYTADLSKGDLVLVHTFKPSVFAALQSVKNAQLSLDAMLCWPLLKATGEYSLPFTASIKSHLSTFFFSF